MFLYNYSYAESSFTEGFSVFEELQPRVPYYRPYRRHSFDRDSYCFCVPVTKVTIPDRRVVVPQWRVLVKLLCESRNLLGLYSLPIKSVFISSLLTTARRTLKDIHFI